MDIQETQSKVANKHYILRKVGKYSLRTLIGIICLVVCLLIIGAIYEHIGEYIDAKTYPCVGKIVNAGTSNINVFAKGEGKCTVVFSSGSGTSSPYADFYPLYNEISKYTRTVVYERPGYGWSELTDAPRDIDTIVKEIHTALTIAKEKPPYILVAHSLGALEAIRFTQTYKSEIAGIIIIDGGLPEYYVDSVPDNQCASSTLSDVMRFIGIGRIIVNYTNYFLEGSAGTANSFKLLPDNLLQLYKVMAIKTINDKDIVAEENMCKINSKTIIDHGYLGDIPLRILTADSSLSSFPDWEKYQENFKKWSTNSTQKVVDGVGHYIHEYKPEVVNDEIIKLLNSIKIQ